MPISPTLASRCPLTSPQNVWLWSWRSLYGVMSALLTTKWVPVFYLLSKSFFIALPHHQISVVPTSAGHTSGYRGWSHRNSNANLWVKHKIWFNGHSVCLYLLRTFLQLQYNINDDGSYLKRPDSVQTMSIHLMSAGFITPRLLRF